MKKFDQLTRLLDFCEENIDGDHIRNIERLQYDAINYKKVDRLPLTISTTLEGFKQVPLKDAFNNPEKMLYNEILWSGNHSSYNSVKIKDDSPLMIRSNHGIGIISSMFGCKELISNNKMPRVRNISLDEAKKAFNKGTPNVKTGLGKKVIENYKYYHERLESFPKCYSTLRITLPDIQGPYDILQLIIGDEALTLPFDDPKLTKYMVDVIASTYVAFIKELEPLLTDKYRDAAFIDGYCCGGRVLIKSNTTTSDLPSHMYNLYASEPASFIFDSFAGQGGGSLNYCGQTNIWNKESTIDKNLKCVNYGNPGMQSLSEKYAFFKKHKIAIVGWGENQEYETVMQTVEIGDEGKPIKTGATLKCKESDPKRAIGLLEMYKIATIKN